jgi:hypothetical protein
MSDNHHYVPLSQAAKELGISTEALRQRIHRNKMDGYNRITELEGKEPCSRTYVNSAAPCTSAHASSET